MFLKTENGKYVNIDNIEAVDTMKAKYSDSKDNRYKMMLYSTNDSSYIGAIYDNKDDAEYAINFLFKHIENTRGEYLVYNVPTQEDVKIYRFADSINEQVAKEQERGNHDEQ